MSFRDREDFPDFSGFPDLTNPSDYLLPLHQDGTETSKLPASRNQQGVFVAAQESTGLTEQMRHLDVLESRRQLGQVPTSHPASLPRSPRLPRLQPHGDFPHASMDHLFMETDVLAARPSCGGLEEQLQLAPEPSLGHLAAQSESLISHPAARFPPTHSWPAAQRPEGRGRSMAALPHQIAGGSYHLDGGVDLQPQKPESPFRQQSDLPQFSSGPPMESASLRSKRRSSHSDSNVQLQSRGRPLSPGAARSRQDAFSPGAVGQVREDPFNFEWHGAKKQKSQTLPQNCSITFSQQDDSLLNMGSRAAQPLQVQLNSRSSTGLSDSISAGSSVDQRAASFLMQPQAPIGQMSLLSGGRGGFLIPMNSNAADQSFPSNASWGVPSSRLPAAAAGPSTSGRAPLLQARAREEAQPMRIARTIQPAQLAQGPHLELPGEYGAAAAQPVQSKGTMTDVLKDIRSSLVQDSTSLLLGIVRNPPNSRPLDTKRKDVVTSWTTLHESIDLHLKSLTMELSNLQDVKKHVETVVKQFEGLDPDVSSRPLVDVAAVQTLLAVHQETQKRTSSQPADTQSSIGTEFAKHCAKLQMNAWSESPSNHIKPPQDIAMELAKSTKPSHIIQRLRLLNKVHSCNLLQLMNLPPAEYKSLTDKYASYISEQQKEAKGSPEMHNEARSRILTAVFELAVLVMAFAAGQPWEVLSSSGLAHPKPENDKKHFSWEAVVAAADFTEVQRNTIIGIYQSMHSSLEDLNRQLDPLMKQFSLLPAAAPKQGTQEMRDVLDTAALVKEVGDKRAVVILNMAASLLLEICSPLQVAAMVGAAHPVILQPCAIVNTVVHSRRTST